MKVIGPNRPIPLDAVRNRGGRTEGRSKEEGPTRGERVQVSDEARSLLEARAPEVPDESRIARLKQAIVDGTFKIDADRIAEAMLKEEL